VVVDAVAGKFETFKHVKTELLLIGGSRSKPVLKRALKALHRLLPQSRFVQLPGVGHIAAENNGKPQMVAQALKAFFNAGSKSE
jgi:pimeloyl-ACP methyl ester carboxylesterase